MGRYVFKLPDVGEGTAEAELVAWHVAVGDHVAEDQHLVDVMTDKATVEMTSPVAGVVISRHGEPGEMAPVGAALVELEIEGEGNKRAEKISEAKKTETTKPSAPSLAPKEGEGKGEEAAKSAQKEDISSHKSGDKPLASPAVRRRAQELGIELQFVRGSGPAGRISHEDLDA
ncbi:MAG TPA: biotin/lipoyl-containing protein, partial [Rhizomicrobium sp.]|nr:biotin/lipoyl-containing protein [Rhizomicrobium sp.]